MPSIIQRSVTYTGNNTTSNPNFTWVNVNSVSWIARTDTATTGTSIVLGSGASAGDTLAVVSFGTF